jgi:hypothetical protein
MPDNGLHWRSLIPNERRKVMPGVLACIDKISPNGAQWNEQ